MGFARHVARILGSLFLHVFLQMKQAYWYPFLDIHQETWYNSCCDVRDKLKSISVLRFMIVKFIVLDCFV